MPEMISLKMFEKWVTENCTNFEGASGDAWMNITDLLMEAQSGRLSPPPSQSCVEVLRAAKERLVADNADFHKDAEYRNLIKQIDAALSAQVQGTDPVIERDRLWCKAILDVQYQATPPNINVNGKLILDVSKLLKRIDELRGSPQGDVAAENALLPQPDSKGAGS